MTAIDNTSPAPARVSSAPPPPVRRMRFRFQDSKTMNRHFIEDDIVMSHLLALLSSFSRRVRSRSSGPCASSPASTTMSPA